MDIVDFGHTKSEAMRDVGFSRLALGGFLVECCLRQTTSAVGVVCPTSLQIRVGHSLMSVVFVCLVFVRVCWVCVCARCA